MSVSLDTFCDLTYTPSMHSIFFSYPILFSLKTKTKNKTKKQVIRPSDLANS